MTAPLKRTPLYPLYSDYGARTIDFGGWELPVQFEGILKEHAAVRKKAGLFDVSHMGELLVAGTDAEAFLQNITTNDLSKLEAGAAQYTLMCYPDGGIVDDLLIYKLDGSRYMAVVNASNIAKDLDWMRKHAEGHVTIDDRSAETALLAVQGPAAVQVLAAAADAAAGSAWTTLRPFRFTESFEIAGARALLSRTGYTGEDGFELYVDAAEAGAVWRRLLSAGSALGLVPAGLGARDTLRFEAGLPLYGQELSPAITPLEAGLGAFVKLTKGDFIGREALAAQKADGVRRRLVGITMIDRGIPRSNYSVYAESGERVGEVTSGTQSPTLQRNLGLSLVNAAYAEPGTVLYVDVRGKRLKANVVNTPFYKRVRAKP